MSYSLATIGETVGKYNCRKGVQGGGGEGIK